jgi:hypothetical protein
MASTYTLTRNYGGLLDFSGNALAPNVLSIKKHLAELSAQRLREGGTRLDYRFPDRDVRRASMLNVQDDTEHSAGLQAGFGFGPFTDPALRASLWSSSERFVPLLPETCAPSLMHAGLLNETPLSIYAVSPFVMLIDRAALGDRALPHHWEDLLDPCYRGQVVVTVEEPADNVAFLSYYRFFGVEGMGAFASNVICRASASVMASLCASDRTTSGSIYVIPWFFARCCAARDKVVIWPEEGALCFPLWLALRRDASEGACFLASYFTGAEFARESARSCLPAAHGASDEVLAEEHKRFSWVGWDFLRDIDLVAYASAVSLCADSIKQVSAL